jgi:tetratricopeptide (TPR) repeat protein
MGNPEDTFSSEGFDLDAASASGDVILEVGGGITKVVEETSQESNASSSTEDDSPIAKCEHFKALGNENYKQGAYLEALDMYTEAIESCPGVTGAEILQEKKEFQERQHELAMENYRRRDQEDRERKSSKSSQNKNDDNNENESSPPAKTYKPQPHPFGENLAIYHSNRAAVCLQLGRYEDAIDDCTIAVLLHPRFAKAWLRRSTAYERTERTEEALMDAKMALELDGPSNVMARKAVQRLQKLEDERLEKLKEETMGKLKDLGNSLLGNFGLSLDNFQTVKNADGGYSISFNQNKGANA